MPNPTTPTAAENTVMLPAGTDRIVHVLAKALRENAAGGKNDPVIAVRTASSPEKIDLVARHVQILGPADLFHSAVPLPGTEGRGVCYLTTRSALLVHLDKELGKSTETKFKVGDRVRLKNPDRVPHHGWPSTLPFRAVGVVGSYRGEDRELYGSGPRLQLGDWATWFVLDEDLELVPTETSPPSSRRRQITNGQAMTEFQKAKKDLPAGFLQDGKGPLGNGKTVSREGRRFFLEEPVPVATSGPLTSAPRSTINDRTEWTCGR